MDNLKKDSNSENVKIVQELITTHKIQTYTIKELKLDSKIGEGGQSQVYHGELNERSVAVKILTDIDIKCLIHEIKILVNISHSNIPKFYGMVLDSDVIGIVTEFIEGKTLDEIKIKEINHFNKMKIVKDIGSALDYLHSISYVHRDLKPQNILVENKTFNTFLIDFGISKIILNEDKTKTRAKGTPSYLAPEIFDCEEISKEDEIISYVTTKADVWSFGCIVSYIFSGKVPWQIEGKKINEAIVQDNLMNKIKFPIPSTIQEQKIIEIIEKSTHVDYKKRSSIKDILPMLENI